MAQDYAGASLEGVLGPDGVLYVVGRVAPAMRQPLSFIVQYQFSETLKYILYQSGRNFYWRRGDHKILTLESCANCDGCKNLSLEHLANKTGIFILALNFDIDLLPQRKYVRAIHVLDTAR